MDLSHRIIELESQLDDTLEFRSNELDPDKSERRVRAGHVAGAGAGLAGLGVTGKAVKDFHDIHKRYRERHPTMTWGQGLQVSARSLKKKYSREGGFHGSVLKDLKLRKKK